MPRRRAKGEGSITQRADGRWHARLTTATGQRVHFYAKTRRDALEKLRHAQQRLARGEPLLPHALLLGSFLRDWLEAIQPTLRPITSQRYERTLRKHVLPTLGSVRLMALTPLHLQRLYAQLMAQGLAASTVSRVHAVLRTALGTAERWGSVHRNVARLVTPPRQPRRPWQVYTTQEVRQLLDTAQGDPLEALYVLAVTTGMRVGELRALPWAAVDLAGGKLRVVQSVALSTISAPKTASARRQIALTPRAVQALTQHRKRQAADRLRAGRAWDEHGLVFCDAIGRLLNRVTLMRHTKRLQARAGLPLIRFHDLRHTCATLLLSRGTPVKVVSELLGHASIAITLQTYGHVLPDMQQAAVTIMEEEVGG